MESRKSRIVVLGNGPSLRDFDFRSLEAADSLGMNAAYRFWERIGWYPNHYCCLDDQLIETHADAIYDMIVNNKVSSAFLIAKILDFHPDLAVRKNVVFLESFNRTRQKRLGDSRVPFIESVPFAESDPSKVTTGSYAIRYAAHLGYREIAILGVDLRYVEVIPEARHGDGIKLVMERTPRTNPNYFFDDYQRAGDKFNVPNPASHSRNLHVTAFELLAHDIVQFEWSARVYNGNRTSVLFDKAIFPFVNVASFARRRMLSAVVVPTTEREEDRLVRNITAWNAPRLSPSAGNRTLPKPDLIFAFSGSENPGLRARLLAACHAAKNVARCFESIEVRFLSMPATTDYYERNYTKKISGRGYKSGPNEQFFDLINSFAGHGEFIFYMESDCVPLRQGWLDRLQECAAGEQEAWVIGSIYRGVEMFDDKFFLHLNGNALYRVGDADFIDFASEYWRPTLHEILALVDKRLAYDCVLSYLFSGARPSVSNSNWHLFQSLAHRFKFTSLIQNISGAADAKLDTQERVRDILIGEPGTFLVHGAPFVTLLHAELVKSLPESDYAGYISWGNVLREVEYSSEQVLVPWKRAVGQALPRMLIIDSTVVGSNSATGQLKQVFVKDWPAAKLLQVYEYRGELYSKNFEQKDGSKDVRGAAAILDDCRSFRPEVIYFRPTDSRALFEFIRTYMSECTTPLLVHMMDDWPERLRTQNAAEFAALDAHLRYVFARAHTRFAIGQKMADCYSSRYGLAFVPLANGVNVDTAPAKDWLVRERFSQEKPFTIRYMGGLARDMTFDSVSDVAAAVSRLTSRLPIRLEIYTMSWYWVEAQEAFGNLAGVSVHEIVAASEYPKLLADADALLIAYNFDEATQRYVGLSVANKLPECLASGVPVVAYGPRSIATIEYLESTQCAEMITLRDPNAISMTLEALLNSPKRCRELGDAARGFAKRHHGRATVVRTFRSAARIAASAEAEVVCVEPNAVEPAHRNVAVSLHTSQSNNVLSDTAEIEAATPVTTEASFAAANRLFQQGMFEAARDMYQQLFSARPLPMYAHNANLASERHKRAILLQRASK